jgi:hypothetical protein
MKKLTLLVAMLAMVSLASATALTQTAPDGLSPVQVAEFDQTVQEGTDASQPAPPPAQEAASSPPPAPECGWYDNPERGWGWDYWCYNPTQQFWVPVIFGFTGDE